ncbi:helix-turn-helix domain-containing protein [Microbacterium sp. NPDC058062]|uniref:helix-turn-helix domain-containing protein n=1 Tax=Microbacterium sp. NPDC058062 TaxID=3346320 RepID=UPI0036DA7CF0
MSNQDVTSTNPAAGYTPDPFYAAVRRNIRAVMVDRGITQRSLANSTGMPLSTLSKKLRGVIESWSAADFHAVYRAFDEQDRPRLFVDLPRVVKA